MLKFKENINEVGIDEAGRGPLLGRVYAGAVIWGDIEKPDFIKDSKKLSKKKRKIAFEWIKENVLDWSIGYATEKEVDDINILEATKLAFIRAIKNLKMEPQNIIIDGVGWEKKRKEPDKICLSTQLNLPISSIVKGDNKLCSIAAASIIAKEYHDNYIKKLCEDNIDLHKKYDLLKNMGYGTKKHIAGIRQYGICEIHRKTFISKKIKP